MEKIKQIIGANKVNNTQKYQMEQNHSIENDSLDVLKTKLEALEQEKHDLFLQLKIILAKEAEDRPKETKKPSDAKQIFLHCA